MKRYITSTISSALVVPGLGQVLNGQIKKGLILMCAVFVIFTAGVIKLIPILMDILQGLGPEELNLKGIQTAINTAKIDMMDNSTMGIIIVVLIIIWIYSIIDAFIYGLRVEKERNQS